MKMRACIFFTGLLTCVILCMPLHAITLFGLDYHVDISNGSDLNDGLSLNTAFATIQKAIDSAQDGDTVLVYPGLYTEEINFRGKAITVRGVAGPAGVPVLESRDDFAVTFCSGEEPDSILKNFIINNSFVAVVMIRSSPTISNVTVVNNEYGIEAYAGSEPDISNSIFWNNSLVDLFGCEARYSWVQDEVLNEAYDGPISYWSFDENIGNVAFDSIRGEHGAIYSEASRIDGISGKALQFDGVDDYVSVPYSDDFQLSVFTISAWIRPDIDLSTSGGVIVARGEDFNTDLASYVFDVRSNDSHFGTGIRLMYEENNDSERYYGTGVFPQVDTWTHLAVSRSLNGQVIIYQDGDVLGQWDSAPAPTTRCFQSLTFGARWISGTTSGPYRLIHFFPGLIDEIKIYDRTLSSEEVQRLYRNELDESELVTNPLFADPENDDYHLLSGQGRYWPEYDVWILDGISSPCIDGGDPNSDYSDEPMPNGGRINMGAYGGTPYAGMSELP